LEGTEESEDEGGSRKSGDEVYLDFEAYNIDSIRVLGLRRVFQETFKRRIVKERMVQLEKNCLRYLFFISSYKIKYS